MNHKFAQLFFGFLAALIIFAGFSSTGSAHAEEGTCGINPVIWDTNTNGVSDVYARVVADEGCEADVSFNWTLSASSGESVSSENPYHYNGSGMRDLYRATWDLVDGTVVTLTLHNEDGLNVSTQATIYSGNGMQVHLAWTSAPECKAHVEGWIDPMVRIFKNGVEFDVFEEPNHTWNRDFDLLPEDGPEVRMGAQAFVYGRDGVTEIPLSGIVERTYPNPCAGGEETDPTFSATIVMGCYNATYNGHADEPALLTLTGTNIYGESIATSYEVVGEFVESIDWVDAADDDLTIYTGQVDITLTYNDQIVAQDDASHDGACGEETPEEAPTTCNVATANNPQVPEGGADRMITAVGDNADWMRLYDAAGNMVAETAGSYAEWMVHAMPNSAYQAIAVGPENTDGGPLCQVGFYTEPGDDDLDYPWLKANLDVGLDLFNGGVVNGEALADGPYYLVIQAYGTSYGRMARFELTHDGQHDWGCVRGENPIPTEGIWVKGFVEDANGNVVMDDVPMATPIPGHPNATWLDTPSNRGLKDAEGCVAIELIWPTNGFGQPGAHAEDGAVVAADHPAAVVSETVVETANDTQIVEANNAEAGTHVVVEGDNLTKIANAHGVTIDEIVDANPQITDANLIVIGWTITIPGA